MRYCPILLVLFSLATTSAFASYLYKQEITLQSSQVPGSGRNNFPVLITQANLDTAFFSNCQQSNPLSMDIVFMDATETTVLYREIVHFDSGNQEFEAWVLIPTLSGSTNTILYMHYGSPTGVANDPETWPTAYRGVWHMQDTPAGSADDILESTAYGNHGTSQAMDLADHVPGQISHALNFDAADYEYLNCGNDASLALAGDFTISAWVQMDSASAPDSYMRIVSKKNDSPDADGYGWSYNPFTDIMHVYGIWTSNYAYATLSLDTNWHYVTAVVSGTNVAFYSDGSSLSMTNNTISTLITNTNDFLIANQDALNPRYYAGQLDEIRVYAGTFNTNWIATEYNNQSNPGSFYSVGSEIFIGTPTNTVTPTQTPTHTPTATVTLTPTQTPTATISATYTPTPSITFTATVSATLTTTPTPSPTSSITATLTMTPSCTNTPEDTPTITPTWTISFTSTISATITPTFTPSPTNTVSPTKTSTITLTQTGTPNIAAKDLSRVIVYPNPFRADVNSRNTVTFFNLPVRADIRIYSLDGRLVKTLQKNSSGNRISWDLNNERKGPAASGVYIFIIQSNIETRKGKIVLMR
jgi:concanavalin A-like lectin/glucanase superfamily protein/type IX secretion system substrate protein